MKQNEVLFWLDFTMYEIAGVDLMGEIYPRGSAKSKEKWNKTWTSWWVSKRSERRPEKVKDDNAVVALNAKPSDEGDTHTACKSLVNL